MKYDNLFENITTSADGGPRSRFRTSEALCSHTRDPLLGPPSTISEIFQHVSLQSHLQTSPPAPQK